MLVITNNKSFDPKTWQYNNIRISMLILYFFFNLDSLKARPNCHYEAWSYKKKKYKKIKAYRKSAKKEPTANRYLLILDSKPFRS